MAIYASTPKRSDPWDLEEYESTMPNTMPRQAYSVAQITFMDGTTHEFMVKAAPSVVPHLVKEMKATGYLTLWNDSDTLCIRADQIKHFSMREITK